MTSSEYKYLQTINGLYDGTVGIRLTAIAAAMEVTKVSVFKAVERLYVFPVAAQKPQQFLIQHVFSPFPVL